MPTKSKKSFLVFRGTKCGLGVVEIKVPKARGKGPNKASNFKVKCSSCSWAGYRLRNSKPCPKCRSKVEKV